jgi:hypothetical protein
MHFITGAAGGTIVGTPMGMIVPSLHAPPVSIVPVSGEGERGIAASAKFCSVLGAMETAQSVRWTQHECVRRVNGAQLAKLTNQKARESCCGV